MVGIVQDDGVITASVLCLPFLDAVQLMHSTDGIPESGVLQHLEKLLRGVVFADVHVFIHLEEGIPLFALLLQGKILCEDDVRIDLSQVFQDGLEISVNLGLSPGFLQHFLLFFPLLPGILGSGSDHVGTPSGAAEDAAGKQKTAYQNDGRQFKYYFHN